MELESRLVATIDVGDILGEGVLWRALDKTIWWVDIQGCRLHCLTWPSQVLKTYETPGRVGSFSFIEGDAKRLLIACENKMGVFTPESGVVTWLGLPISSINPGVRLNDGRTDAHGRFWVGTMAEGEIGDGVLPAHLYRVDKSGLPQCILGDIHVSNGLCWSPSGDWMYFADSPSGNVYRASYDMEYGVAGMFKPFASFANESPDGAVTDSSGNYWTALWGGSRVAVLDTDGNEISELNLPISQPTCVAFAGDDLNLLCITSAKDGLSANEMKNQPHAGSLFIYLTNIIGLEPNGFRLYGT